MQTSKINFFGLALLLSLLVLLSMTVCAQQDRSVAGISTKAEPPRVGLRVIRTEYGTPAEEAGLQFMDVISRYGNYQIVDASSYFTALEAYEKFPDAKVEMVYWHNREQVVTWVKAGRLGIEFNEYSVVAYQLDGLMQLLDLTIEAPDYFVESQVAAGKMQPREKVLSQLLALIDRAQIDGSLSPAQILVAKIKAIPDDAPPAEIEKQAELIKDLVTNQPRGYTDYLGYGTFFEHKRYRAAAACFRRLLEANPDDVSTRLNLGVAYSRLGMFDEADAAADYGLKHPGLTARGHAVAYQVKANAALGRRDFSKALDFAEKAFQADPSSDYFMALWQFAAAQAGDVQKFYEVVEATEKALPKAYETLRGRTDILEACVLFRNNQSDKARSLALKWAGKENLLTNSRYWRKYPSGDDVLKVWKQLLSQN